MKEPACVDVADSLALHGELLARFGGLGGVRDEGLLESALNRPRQRLAYQDASLHELAAAYAAGIVKTHPFLDGNKRTGFIVAALFLELNGLRFAAPEEQAVLHTLALAAGEESEEEYAAWLREACGS